MAATDFPDDFVPAAGACLAFARNKPNDFRLLSRRDIEVVVKHGAPFLFKNGDVSVRRMRSYLAYSESNVLDTDKAHTVDLMKFLLSYACNPSVSSERDNFGNEQLVESSVRSLFSELAKLSYCTSDSNSFGSMQNQSSDRFGPTPEPVGQKVEMKRGDWICPRCSFLNFARNMKCLECEETRPKKQLTGGEWECPQCDFFNYGRNMVCLRCDCKRPGEVSPVTSENPSVGHGTGKSTNKADIDSLLAANEEKAQRWFSKVSQLDGISDMSSAIADEDFPEIMPLRKGINRFVVSTRKTPLERRLTNSQFQRNLGKDGTTDSNAFQSSAPNRTVNQSLDEILGRSSGVSESNNKNVTAAQNPGSDRPHSASPQHGTSRVSNSNYVPFVPLPADMFAKNLENSKTEGSEKGVTDEQKSVASNTIDRVNDAPGSTDRHKSGSRLQQTENPVSQTENNDKEKEQAEKSERWFKKVAELHNVTDLSSAISDEDFPEIMPLRKGENRFVVSKKKDRSLTSPTYKRRMAMEQANNTNYVPFVPFPPDYFARKDKQQPDGGDLTGKAAQETSSVLAERVPEKSYEAEASAVDVDGLQQTGNHKMTMESRNARNGENKTGTVYGEQSTGNLTQGCVNSRSEKDSASSWDPTKEKINSTSLAEPSDSQNIRESWKGKSLEGSAVKEPDPLDMSEEAKAQRWFRRVAQIKDISELSQIPDEDFPSIMPMRKGVNRFVVSKRKTPLERRLTSPQYRRNLPTVNYDPEKKENDSS